MEFHRAEYEIQHFGFSVAQLKLEHRFMVKTHVETLAEDFAKSLIKKSNISATLADTMRGKSKQVAEKIMSTIEEELNTIDDMFEKYFSIPDNVLLVEDMRHADPSCTPDEEEYAKMRVAEMEETFKQNKYLLASLEGELKLYKELLPFLELESGVMQKVEESFKSNLNFHDAKSSAKKVDDMLKLKRETDDFRN